MHERGRAGEEQTPPRYAGTRTWDSILGLRDPILSGRQSRDQRSRGDLCVKATSEEGTVAPLTGFAPADASCALRASRELPQRCSRVRT